MLAENAVAEEHQDSEECRCTAWFSAKPLDAGWKRRCEVGNAVAETTPRFWGMQVHSVVQCQAPGCWLETPLQKDTKILGNAGAQRGSVPSPWMLAGNAVAKLETPLQKDTKILGKVDAQRGSVPSPWMLAGNAVAKLETPLQR
jgi:hypothetical protein